MTVEIHPGPGSLRAVVSGEFSMDEAKRTFLAILDAAARHRAGKVLIDGRELKGEPNIIQRFLFARFAAHAVASHPKRGAPYTSRFDCIPREPVFEPQRFGETVAVNRGMGVRSFEDSGEALEWLGWRAAGGRPGARRPGVRVPHYQSRSAFGERPTGFDSKVFRGSRLMGWQNRGGALWPFSTR